MAKRPIDVSGIDLSDIDLKVVDLEKYDFDGLRSDVSNILSIQLAVKTILKWALIIPIVGTVITWVLFDDRMSGWIFTPWMFLVTLAFVLAAINLGIFFVLRNRIAETNTAADRVIDLTSELHGDYLKIRSGETDLPMGALASALTEQLIFPALTGGVMSATTMTGPIGMLARPLLKRPLAAVEIRVLEALNTTPDPDVPALEQSSAHSDDSQDTESADLVTPALGAGLPPELEDWYDSIHNGLRRVVGGVGTVATGSMGTVLFLATMPLITLLVLGWLLT